MSRDYRAKRLAREQNIPYAEALRRVRAADQRPLEDPDRPEEADERSEARP